MAPPRRSGWRNSVGIVLVLQSHYIRARIFHEGLSLSRFPRRFDERAATLEVTIAPCLRQFLGLLIALTSLRRAAVRGALALIARHRRDHLLAVSPHRR
jgi:hypothetical protein